MAKERQNLRQIAVLSSTSRMLRCRPFFGDIAAATEGSSGSMSVLYLNFTMLPLSRRPSGGAWFGGAILTNGTNCRGKSLQIYSQWDGV
jgi:hypothetical protein